MNAKERGSIEIDTLHDIIDSLTYYEILLCSEDSTPTELSEKYRILVKKYNPERNTNYPNKQEEVSYIYKAISESYQTLKQPETRLIYDALLAQGYARKQDSQLRESKTANASNDPKSAPTNDNSKKYWFMALDDMEQSKFASAVINIKFALQFETDSDAKEVFEQYLEKAEEGKARAPKSQHNAYKIRLS
jgi:curved DNA-binding protein CbpA